MLEAYLESQRGRYAANTLQLYASWLHQLARRGELLELGAAELVAFRQELCWKPGPSGRLYSEHSQNQAIGAIRSFYRWALSAGLLQTDPTAGLKMRAVPRKRVEKTDLRPLLLAPDPYTLLGIRDRAVLGVLAETGISQTACSRRDLDHLQTDTGASARAVAARCTA
ncbi:MAG: tyrosine-type recombinase/integrase [Vulcanimicrobiota bacterium]